ncbi:arrestin domain-containing protein 2-like [Diadema antillarum]|uniref:arrestin domain-containing protein 2-like n=1 Tax=Diadema antillarum TaxID=105358 RepID=UPI003A8BED90
MLNMGAVKGFDVFLDDPLEVYHVGETLRGHVILTLTKDLAMKGIRVAVKGEIRTQWRERHASVAGGKRGSIYRGGEQLFLERKTVWGNEPDDKSEIPLLTAGSYSFPFQFRLPAGPGLPCSFECGSLANVRYLVHANMDISWAVDPVAERYFSFIGSEINCNLPKHQKTLNASDRKTLLRCCFRSSGPIALKAEMQRNAYCAGEYVNIKTRLENNSDKVMRLGVKFIQNVTFVAEVPKRVTKAGSYEILSYSSPCVLPDQEYCLQTARMLQIPIVPSSIETRFISIRYVIEISLIVDEKPELNISFPVTIGNVPFKDSRGKSRELNYGHACVQSCGANTEIVHYRDGERVVQLKHFTPLYLTVSAAHDQADSRHMLPQQPNGTPAVNHCGAPNNGNGNGTTANGYLMRDDNPVISHRQSGSAISNGFSFDRAVSRDFEAADDFDASVIASKSSGSVTKYSTRATTGTGVLSRKPSKEDGYDEHGQFGMAHLHQNENMFAISGHSVDMNPMDEIQASTFFQIDIGDDGQMYECHYV